MRRKNVYILVLSLFFLAGCYNEDDIAPREGDEFSFKLPQGQHDYDADLVNYHEKYGFYPLYVFTERDLYWNNTTWNGGTLNPGEANGDLLGKCGDPDHVGKQWELCKKVFLNHYPDDLLKRMPFKFLLCSELLQRKMKSYDPINKVYSYDTVRRATYRSFDFIAVNYGSASIDTISQNTKLEFSAAINKEFLLLLNDKKLLELSEEFASVHKYNQENLRGEDLFKKGYLNNATALSDNVEKRKLNDFAAYLELVALPLELLECEPAPIGFDYMATLTPPLVGALHERRDVNKLVRMKYNILLKYLKEKYDIETGKFKYPSF